MRYEIIKREFQMTEIYALIVCKLVYDAVVFYLKVIAKAHFDSSVEVK